MSIDDYSRKECPMPLRCAARRGSASRAHLDVGREVSRASAHTADLRRLQHLDTGRPRAVEQQRIEAISAYRPAVAISPGGARRKIRGEERIAAHPAHPGKLRSGHGPKRLPDAERIEELQASRGDAPATDLLAGIGALLRQDHAPARPGQQDRGGTARRAAPDDQCIGDATHETFPPMCGIGAPPRSTD